MRKRMTLVCVCLCAFMSIGGCGRAKPKTEAEIELDVISNDALCRQYENAGMEFVSQQLYIEDRRTSIENGTDIIWCEFYCETDTFSYTASYRIDYSYYEQGWLLDSQEKIGESVELKSKPILEDSIARQVLALEDFNKSEFISCVVEGKEAIITAKMTDYREYKNIYRNYELEYRFNTAPDGGWEYIDY